MHRRCPLEGEGAGKAGRQPHPQPRLQMKKANERSHYRFSQNNPAFPAQWFYGLFRALPGERPLLPPSPAGLTANLTPGSRRQDHTTSPYAAGVSPGEKTRLTPQRPSQPAPTFRDDRVASPLVGTGWADYY